MAKNWIEVERNFKNFMNKNGFCIKLISRANGDRWLELHGGGINVGTTRLFSKSVAFLNFYDNGVFCRLISGAPSDSIKGFCREFSESTKLGVIISPDFFPDHYSQKTETSINKMLKKGYQE